MQNNWQMMNIFRLIFHLLMGIIIGPMENQCPFMYLRWLKFIQTVRILLGKIFKSLFRWSINDVDYNVKETSE